MNNLAQRAVTGTLLVAVIIASVMLGPYSFVLLVLAINILSLPEFYRLFDTGGVQPRTVEGIIVSVAILISSALAASGAMGHKVLLLNIPLAFCIFVIELYRGAKNPFHNLAFTFLGIFCITVPLCFFITIAFLPGLKGVYHWPVILGYFCMLWAADTGAYFTGKAFGRHPLFQRISPKKTWEGWVGGTACTLLAAYTLSRCFSALGTIQWLGMAVIVAVAGTYGDLVKSLMKRSLNIKDAGSILPGHGGMLDRFDTLLGSAPFIFCYLTLFHHA